MEKPLTLFISVSHYEWSQCNVRFKLSVSIQSTPSDIDAVKWLFIVGRKTSSTVELRHSQSTHQSQTCHWRSRFTEWVKRVAHPLWIAIWRGLYRKPYIIMLRTVLIEVKVFYQTPRVCIVLYRVYICTQQQVFYTKMVCNPLCPTPLRDYLLNIQFRQVAVVLP